MILEYVVLAVGLVLGVLGGLGLLGAHVLTRRAATALDTRQRLMTDWERRLNALHGDLYRQHVALVSAQHSLEYWAAQHGVRWVYEPAEGRAAPPGRL